MSMYHRHRGVAVVRIARDSYDRLQVWRSCQPVPPSVSRVVSMAVDEFVAAHPAPDRGTPKS